MIYKVWNVSKYLLIFFIMILASLDGVLISSLFKNLIDLGYSITDAFKMTSTNAAKEFKLNTGILKEGKDADLVVLDKDYKVCMTVVKGKIKFINL